MKRYVLGLIVACALTTSAAAVNETYSTLQNKVVSFLTLQQGLDDQQKQQAIALVSSVHTLATTVKQPRQDLKQFVAHLGDVDRIEPEQLMESYTQWRQQVDSHVEATIHQLAAFHASLTPEQRHNLMAAIKQRLKATTAE